MSELAGWYDFRIGFINLYVALNLRFFQAQQRRLQGKNDMTAKQIVTNKDASLKIAPYCFNHYKILPNENRHVDSL